MASLAKRFPLAYWTSYGVLGKALPTCLLDIVWRPWQSASLLPIGHLMASLAKRFPIAHWTSYGVLGKALPSCTPSLSLTLSLYLYKHFKRLHVAIFKNARTKKKKGKRKENSFSSSFLVSLSKDIFLYTWHCIYVRCYLIDH